MVDQVERFFAELTEKRIRAACSGRDGLEDAIAAYLAEHNRDPKPFRWTATADLILRRVEDVVNDCNSGH